MEYKVGTKVYVYENLLSDKDKKKYVDQPFIISNIEKCYSFTYYRIRSLVDGKTFHCFDDVFDKWYMLRKFLRKVNKTYD